VGNRSFPFDARIKLELVTKKIIFVTHGSDDVVLIICMMGQFCRTFHCEGCVPGKVLQGVTKALVCIARTMSLNSADYSVRSLLFLGNAYAIDKYKWER
jgi:hypothetical protein